MLVIFLSEEMIIFCDPLFKIVAHEERRNTNSKSSRFIFLFYSPSQVRTFQSIADNIYISALSIDKSSEIRYKSSGIRNFQKYIRSFSFLTSCMAKVP